MPNPIKDQTGFLIGGCDSQNDPAFLDKQNAPTYVWAWNLMHRGGRPQTRNGFSELIEPPIQGEQSDGLTPQGICWFKPINQGWHLVMAHAGLIYKSPYPFTQWFQIPGLQFYSMCDQIIFEPRCIRSQQINPDLSITFFDNPYPVLMIQDGFTRAGFWDGTTARHLDPSPTGMETHIGQAMIWNSNRLWVGDGHKLHAGDFGDPLGAIEETVPVTGGFFPTLSGEDITAIAETPDLKALLVFSDNATDTIQSAIQDRTQWETTPGFQTQLFRQIGCVGPFAWVNQYGLTWWMTHGGIISLDTALQTYRTRRIKYSDYGVARSKAKLHSNLRRVCAGFYENFLFFSWPSADIYNAHTVVMDQLSYEVTAPENISSSWAGAWKGIRPVQWATNVINGKSRCVALSRDYSPSRGLNYQIGIWEAFTKQRMDVQIDGTISRINCGIEFRQMAYGMDVKKLDYFEASVSEGRNRIDVTMWANGRATGFSQLGVKRIQADQVNPDTTIADGYREQCRIMGTTQVLKSTATYVSAQKKWQEFVDYGFGTMMQWIGELAVDAVRIFCDVQPDKRMGTVEVIEETARLVSWDNDEQITDQPPATVYADPQQSGGFIDSITERYVEPDYSSRGN